MPTNVNPTDLGAFAQVLAHLTQAMQPGMALLRPVLLALLGMLLALTRRRPRAELWEGAR